MKRNAVKENWEREFAKKDEDEGLKVKNSSPAEGTWILRLVKAASVTRTQN